MVGSGLPTTPSLALPLTGQYSGAAKKPLDLGSSPGLSTCHCVTLEFLNLTKPVSFSGKQGERLISLSEML